MPSGGFLALLDDVATMTRQIAMSVDDVSTLAHMTSKGVQATTALTVDDIPVSAEALSSQKIEPKRELPIIKRIYFNALKTRLAVTPVTSLISHFAPAAMPVILGLGGAYLAYEGAEKVLHNFMPEHDAHDEQIENAAKQKLTPEQREKKLVKSATITDGVMATEISFMAMDQIAKHFPDSGPVNKFASLLGVNTFIASTIYMAVGGLVKMDDLGLKMMTKQGDGLFSKGIRTIGRGLLSAAPKISSFLSRAGTGAMLWIGGELLTPGVSAVAKLAGWTGLHNGAEALIHGIHSFSHAAQAAVPSAVSFMSGFAGWAADTISYQGIGLLAGIGIVGGVKLAEKAYDYVRDMRHAKAMNPELSTQATVQTNDVETKYAPTFALAQTGPAIQAPYKLTEIAKAVIEMGQTSQQAIRTLGMAPQWGMSAKPTMAF